MNIPILRPYVLLRCKKCNRKTDHAVISVVNSKKGEIEDTFECQECGEIKVIYKLPSDAQFASQIKK